MKHLLATGRVFFGICIAGIGVLHFLYPGIRPIIIPDLTNIPFGLNWIVVLTALLLFITGLLIVIGKKFHTLSLIMGVVFLALFLFAHLPVFLSAGPQNSDLYYAVRFPQWKEGENFIGVITCMAFCGIALIISQKRTDKKVKHAV